MISTLGKRNEKGRERKEGRWVWKMGTIRCAYIDKWFCICTAAENDATFCICHQFHWFVFRHCKRWWSEPELIDSA